MSVISDRKLSVLGNTLNGKKDKLDAHVCDTVMGSCGEGEGQEEGAAGVPKVCLLLEVFFATQGLFCHMSRSLSAAVDLGGIFSIVGVSP